MSVILYLTQGLVKREKWPVFACFIKAWRLFILSAILPNVSTTNGTTERRKVTYQIAMCGKDGVVLASDQSERLVNSSETVATQNLVRKLRIAGQFAWCCAGGRLARLLADHFGNAVTRFHPKSALDAAKQLADSVGPAFTEWHSSAATGESYTCVTLVCGAEKKIFRNVFTRSGECDEMQGGWCVAGTEFNVASFLPRRFYSAEMSVDELACLAAYSIHVAHDFDSPMVNGLDIAVYRDAVGRFEFVDSTFYWNEIQRFDAGMRKAIKEMAPDIANHLV